MFLTISIASVDAVEVSTPDDVVVGSVASDVVGVPELGGSGVLVGSLWVAVAHAPMTKIITVR